MNGVGPGDPIYGTAEDTAHHAATAADEGVRAPTEDGMDALLYVEVEVDGATFLFGAADRAMARLMGDTEQLVAIRARAAREKLGRELTAEERQELARIEEADLPVNMVESLCEIFVEGIRDWRGVNDLSRPRQGGGYEPLPCNPETIREFPSTQKVVVVSVYQRRRAELEEKRGSAGEPATSSPPDGPTSDG